MADGIDINSQLNLMGFGRNSSSGGGEGGAAGEAMSHEENLSKAVDKGMQQAVKAITNIVGLPLNSDIEGKSALAGFDANVGGGLSLSNLAVLRPESGGGWLSMLLDMIRRHFVRDIPGGGGAPDGGGGGGGGGGSFDGGDGGGGSAMMSGGGDFSAPPIGAPDVPDMQVNYGGRMMSGDSMIAALGNLAPPETPVARSAERGGGMEV